MDYVVYAYDGYGGYRWVGAFASRKAYLDAMENRGECRRVVKDKMARASNQKEIALAMSQRGAIIKSNV